MKRSSLLLVMLAVFLVGSTALGASFTVYYDVMGLTTDFVPDELKANVDATGVTGLNLSRGPGIKAAGLTNGFSADGWNSAVPSRAGAIAADTYFQFGVSVDQGFTASLATLDLSLRRSALNGPMNYELQASLDGFATPGFTVSEFTYRGRTSGTRPFPEPLDSDPYYYMHSDLAGHPNTATSPGDPIPTVDLTAIAQLQNLPEGTVITFRLYGWGNDSTTATNTVALGRVVGPKITGTVEAK